jgi:hypothetical protein
MIEPGILGVRLRVSIMRIVNQVPDRDAVVPPRRSTISSHVADFRLPPYEFVTMNRTVRGNSPHRASPRVSSNREIPVMARETIYLVQAFTQGKRARLNADTPIRCKSPESALKTAERLEISKAGVVAFSTSGDAELGEYDDEPVVFFKVGRLPAQFQDQ